MVPSISQVGDTYTLTSVIKETATGDALRTDVFKVDGQEKILGALDQLAGKIRSHLGESESSISRTSKPLGEVTTVSFPALQHYAIGYDNEQNGRFKEAQQHYENALDNDSTFVLAVGALGTLEYQQFDRFKGMDYLNAAVDMSTETTALESFAIRAAHAIAVEQDYEKAAEIYETMLREYPDASIYRNYLGAVYGMLGKHKEAVTEYREAIRAEPTLMIAYNGLATEYLDHLGRVDLALVWLRRQMAYDPEIALPYANLAYAYIGADSLDQAGAALDQALVYDAELGFGLELAGHLLWLEGRYDESLVMFARMLAANPDAVEPHYYMGVVYQSKGAGTNARDHFDRFRRVSQWRTEDNPDNAGYFFDLGVVLARMGQTNRSRAAGDRAAEIDPAAYYNLARLYSVQGRTDDAFELLGRAVDAGFRDLVVLKYHPDFKNMRADPRLAQILETYLKV